MIGTALAFVLYFSLIAETGAGRATLVGYAIPPIALAYGAVLLDETITGAAIAGLVLILVGVALAERERRGSCRRRPSPSPCAPAAVPLRSSRAAA